MFGMSQNRRMVLAVDASNRVLLLMASSGRVLAEHALPAGTPLAAHLHANFQLVVQTGGAAVVLLVKRGRAHVLRPCEGLTDGAQPPAGSADGGDSGDPGGGGGGGGSGQAAAGALVAAAFDPARSFRVFGVTAGGHLLVLTVPSGAAAHQCRVMQRIKLGLPPGPVHLVAGSGSLVLLHAAGVAAFSVSAHKVALAGSLRVSHTWEQLWQLHGLSAQHRQLQATDPGAAAAWEGAGGGEVLHTPATGTSLAAAAAASGLLLLPLGDRGAAVFGMAARAPGGSGARFEGGASTGGGGGGGQQQVNWVKLAQPFVVVGMLVVGAWQFIRASSRANLDRFRTARYGGRYGSGGGGPDSLMGGGGLHGLEGLSPDDISSAMGLWGGAGFGPGMDRDLGPYAGPRGRRPTDPREQLAGYGGLGALTARRRARAAMFSNRQQPGGGGGGGAMQQQSLGGRQGRGAAAAGIARAAQLAAEEDAAEQQQRQRQRQERLAASGRGVHFADQRSGSGSEGGASPPGGGRPASAGEEGEGSGGSGSWEQRPAAPASQTRAPDEVPIIPGRIGGFGAAAAPGSGASTACDSDAEAADAGALAAQLAEAVGHVPAKRER